MPHLGISNIVILVITLIIGLAAGAAIFWAVVVQKRGIKIGSVEVVTDRINRILPTNNSKQNKLAVFQNFPRYFSDVLGSQELLLKNVFSLYRGYYIGYLKRHCGVPHNNIQNNKFLTNATRSIDLAIYKTIISRLLLVVFRDSLPNYAEMSDDARRDVHLKISFYKKGDRIYDWYYSVATTIRNCIHTSIDEGWSNNDNDYIVFKDFCNTCEMVDLMLLVVKFFESINSDREKVFDLMGSDDESFDSSRIVGRWESIFSSLGLNQILK
jgi:hypothetical protein